MREEEALRRVWEMLEQEREGVIAGNGQTDRFQCAAGVVGPGSTDVPQGEGTRRPGQHLQRGRGVGGSGGEAEPPCLP